MTPLNQLLERLRELEDHEIGITGRIAYLCAIAAAESLLEEEERYINHAKKKYHEEITSHNIIVNNSR